MALSKTFGRELDRLFHRRTHWLRRELGKTSAGRPPQFRRQDVNRAIINLQKIASHSLANKLAKTEFSERVKLRKGYRIKGRGPKEKKSLFVPWLERHFGKRQAVVYSFWSKQGKCLYVGRTGPHGSRPSDHFEKYWFGAARRIVVFSIAGASHVRKLECLAIHRFQPLRNKILAAGRKWTKACPLCTTHKYIERELRGIFRLK